MNQRLVSVIFIATAVAARAATDVTSSLEYLFAPMESRYGTSSDYQSSRACHCLEYIDGRIYIGGGDWNVNSGPVPIISILPGATPTWTNEYSAGTENIEAYKKFSDGRIWARATDPREHDSNYGSFFAKYPGGDWVRCPLGKIDWNPAHQLNGAELYTHSWDFCEYGTNFYFTGYGIGGSQYWLNGDDTFSHQMGSVTAGQTNGYYRYTYYTNGKKTAQDQNYERFLTLMPFTNGCIAVTYHYYVTGNPNLNPCYYWKLDDPPGWRFRRVDCPWDTFLSGYQSVDRELSSFSQGWIHFREATPFKGRVYYIVNPGWSQGYPVGFFSAAMDASGNITSQRHSFDGGYSHPIDIAVVGGSMYVMTVNSSKKHGIWKTTDGQNFTQLATFTSDQYAQSFTYAKGHFYIGYGVLSTTKAGQIWRFALPQADDDGSNDGKDFTNAPWYWGELGVPNAFVQGFTGAGVKVGVVDTGIRPIVGGSVTNMAIDVRGGDLSQTEPHGLGVASIIKSDKFGVAPDCTLYAYNGTGFTDDINGIRWCFTNGCRIVNFSGGYTPFDYTDEQLAWATNQIRAMLAQGLILVAAGGNAPNETLTFPQDIEGVINIAGLRRDRTSAGLNDNWAKDFATFGQDVPLYTSDTGATGTDGGSSFAAPMATGICALYLQQNPNLTRDELYEILNSTCVKLSDGPSKIWGHGLLQAGRIPAGYKTQSQIDAEKAAYVKTLSATLLNNGLTLTNGIYRIGMYPGETRTLKYSPAPANATDTNLYWYCGNTSDFNPVGLDQVLTVPSATATGKFLVYDGRNRERETICRLRVNVVAHGSESASDVPDSSDPPDVPDPLDVPDVPTVNGGWFTVDCVAAVVSAPLDYSPTLLGYCASNAWMEITLPIHASEEEPAFVNGELAKLYLTAGSGGEAGSFRLHTADGWVSTSAPGVSPASGGMHTVRFEFLKGTATNRMMRCKIDGITLMSDNTEWFPMTTGGDVTGFSIFGDGVISNFFGRFADTFDGAPDGQAFLERLGGVPPVIGAYTAEGIQVPAITIADGQVGVAVPETVAGIYYTAFVADTLQGPWTAAAASSLSAGGPMRFALSALDPASGRQKPTLFISIVASDAPYAAGAVK